MQTNTDQKVRTVVLGATGMVGQRLLQRLADHPDLSLDGLAASDRSAGKTYGEAADWRLPGGPPEGMAGRPVGRCDPADFPGTPGIALSALPSDSARVAEPAFAAAGWTVVSNASAFRQDPKVPLIVPEVNADHLDLADTQDTPGRILTNPNCVAVPLSLALKPLDDEAGIEAVQVSTYQAVSGAGFGGETAWGMLDNVHPHPGDEEEKVQEEPQRILGTLAEGAVRPHAMKVSARCVRVPVRDGHLLAVSVGLKRPLTPQAACDLFRDWRPAATRSLPSAPDRPLLVLEARDRPAPALDVDTGRGMVVTVGRVEACPVFDLKFYVLGHNTVRGAAGAALLNAELVVERSRRRDTVGA